MTASSPLAHEPASRPASRLGRERAGEGDVDRERERDSGRVLGVSSKPKSCE